MVAACEGGLLAYLLRVPDPRGRPFPFISVLKLRRRHSSSAMLTAVFCAVSEVTLGLWNGSTICRLTSGIGWDTPAGHPNWIAFEIS